jgi:hypothetical protein
LDLIRQDYQPGRRYGGRIELSSPTASRQLRADISQEKDKSNRHITVDENISPK